ncbi:hypothetical protein EU545_01160 [Candidatus Thorarchaeota archaeon]|nr:MAG: hypothetical protein EU545_01160 [Candidatus Thorarchaeota archaeon]
MNEKITPRGFEDVLKMLQEMQQFAEKRHDEFQVALSGSLRLMTADRVETIERLHGSRKELMGYLIRKHLHVKQDILDTYRKLEREIVALRSATQNQ